MFLNPFGMASRVGTVLLAGYIGWQGWTNLGPNHSGAGSTRLTLADRAIPLIVDDLRDHRGEMRDAALLPFTGDSSGYFNDTLRKTIENQGTFELADQGIIDRLRDLVGIRPDAVEIPEEAIAAARDMDVDCVIFGRVDRFESFTEGAQLDVTYYIANVETGETVRTGRYFEDTSQPELAAGIVGEDGNIDARATGGVDSGTAGAVGEVIVPLPETTLGMDRPPTNLTWWLRRCLSWAVVVLLLPVFTIGFIKTMVSKRSNRVNAFILVIYTIVDALLAYILVGPAIGALWPLIGFTAAVAVVFLYNTQVMTFALKLGEE